MSRTARLAVVAAGGRLVLFMKKDGVLRGSNITRQYLEQDNKHSELRCDPLEAVVSSATTAVATHRANTLGS